MNNNPGSKKNIWQRLIAWMLALIMIIGSVPTNIYVGAEEIAYEDSSDLLIKNEDEYSEAMVSLADVEMENEIGDADEEIQIAAVDEFETDIMLGMDDEEEAEQIIDEGIIPEENVSLETEIISETESEFENETETETESETVSETETEQETTEASMDLSAIIIMSSEEFKGFLNTQSQEMIREFVEGLTDEEYEIFQHYMETLEPEVMNALLEMLGSEEAMMLAANPADARLTINIQKVWDDAGHEKDRPDSIPIEIFRIDGEKETTVRSLNLTEGADGEWKAAETGLLLYDNQNKPISYGIRETSVPGNYKSKISTPNKLASTGSGATTTETVQKTAWVPVTSLIPDCNYIITTANSGTAGVVGINGDQATLNQQTVAINNKEISVNGQMVRGYITEEEAAGITKWTAYRTDWNSDYVNLGINGNQFLQNFNTNVTSSTLWANKFGYDSKLHEIFAIDSFNKVKKYLNQNNQFYAPTPEGRHTYLYMETTINEYVETPVPDYQDQTWNFTITNTWKENTIIPDTNAVKDLTIKKIWIGDDITTRPEEVKVMVTGTAGQRETRREELTLTAQNGWEAVLQNLPLTTQDGTIIYYEVIEQEIPQGYVGDVKISVLKEDQPWVCELINTRMETADTMMKLNIEKKWAGDEEHLDTRPDQLTLQLYKKQNGVEENLQEVILKKDSEQPWKTTIEVPMADDTGHMITYGVKEMAIPSGYQGEVTLLQTSDIRESTIQITNTYVGKPNANLTLQIVKEWDDKGHEEKRPTSLNLEIYQVIKENETKIKEVTLPINGEWKATLENLPAVVDGESITYKVKETQVPEGYKSEIVFVKDGEDAEKEMQTIGQKQVTCKITNTYMDSTELVRNPGKIQVHAQKYLDEAAPGNNQFTFKLKDEGTGLLKGDAKTNNANGAITFDELEYNQTGIFSLIVEEQKGNDNTFIYSADQKVQIAVTLSLDLSQIKTSLFCGNAGSDYIYLEINGEPMKVYSISKSESLPNAYYSVIAEPSASQLSNQADLRKIMYFMDTNNGIITVNGKDVLLTAETKQNIVWAATNQITASENVNGVSYADLINYIKGNSNPPGNYIVALAQTNGLSGQKVIAGYYKDRAEIDYICNVSNEVTLNNYTKTSIPSAEDGKFVIKAQKTVDGHAPGKDNIFEFTLVGTDNNTRAISETVKNNEKGEIVFPEKTYPAGEYKVIEVIDPNRPDLEFDTEVKTVTVKMSSKVAADAAAGSIVTGGGTSNGMNTSMIQVKTNEYTQDGYCMRQGFSSPDGNKYVGEMDPSEARLREIASRASKGVGNVTRYTGTLEDTLKKIIYFASQNYGKEFRVSSGILKIEYNEVQQLIWYTLGQTDVLVNGSISRNVFHDNAYPGSSSVTMRNSVAYIVNNTPLPPNYHLIAYTTSNTGAQPIIAAVGSETIVTYATSTVPVFNNKTRTEIPPTGTTEASVEITAKKYLDGGAPGSHAFQFLLKDESGHQIGKEVVNDSEGNVRFPAITYTQPGTYKYTIEEVKDGQLGIVYDKNSKKEVTVTVTAEMIKFGTESTKFVGNTQSGNGINAFNYTMTNGDYIGNAYCMNSSLSRPSGQEFSYVKNPNSYSHLFKGKEPEYVNLNANDMQQLKNALYYFETEAGNQLSKTAKNEIIWALCCKRNSVSLGMVNGKVDADYNAPNYGVGMNFTQIRSSKWFNDAINTQCPDGYDLIVFNSGNVNVQPLAMLVPAPKVEYKTSASVDGEVEFYNETEDVPPPVPGNPEVQVKAEKTVDGRQPGKDLIFSFRLWDKDPRTNLDAKVISEATNTAEGEIVFLDKITKAGSYWIEEVEDNVGYPDIKFDEARYKEIKVEIETKSEIIQDGVTKYDVGTGTAASDVVNLSIVLNKGEADERKLQAYCINEKTTAPVDDQYHIYVDPSNQDIAQHTIGSNYTVADLKKLLYYFDNPANQSITFRTKLTGEAATAYFNNWSKQRLVWLLTGSNEEGAPNSWYTQPTQGVMKPYATNREVLDAILNQVPEAPSNYQLILAIQGNTVTTPDGHKQPIVAGYLPRQRLKITYEGSATSVIFQNETRKEVVGFKLKKVDGKSEKPLEVLNNAVRFELRDKDKKLVNTPDGKAEYSLDKNGEISFEGLQPGTYYLKETNTPQGYMGLPAQLKIELARDPKMASGISIKVTAEGEGVDADKVKQWYFEIENASLEESNPNPGETPKLPVLTIKNYKSINVPETGSNGLFRFLNIGMILLLAGLLLMIRSWRKEREEY